MSKHSSSQNQITEGVIWKQILIFFFPIVIGTLFQQLYNTVDAVIVGRFVGKEALASVGGSASVISYQVIMIFTGLASGASVIISQCYGAKDSKRLDHGIHTAFAFSILASIAISILGWFLTPWLLTIMKTPADILNDSILYLRIFFLGIISTLIYNMGSSIMRAIGDSKRPLYYLIVCCFANIFLDLLFVVVFKMGIAGAAIATVIAQTISALLVIHALCTSYHDLRLNLRNLHINLRILKSELRIGLPASLQSCMYGLTNIIIQTAVNGFGTNTTAAWGAFGKMDSIFWAVSGAFGITVSTFAGQNYGAGKRTRVYKSLRICLLLSLLINGGILGFMMLFAEPLFSLFTADANVVQIGVYMLLHVVPSYLIYIFVEIFTGTLRGIGDVFIPTLITIFGICGVRLPWILIMTNIRNELWVILVSYPLAWAATALLLVPYYFYRKRILMKDVKNCKEKAV